MFTLFYYTLTLIIIQSFNDQYNGLNVNGHNILKYEPNIIKKTNNAIFINRNIDNSNENYATEMYRRSTLIQSPSHYDTRENVKHSNWFENRFMKNVYKEKNSKELDNVKNSPTITSVLNNNNTKNKSDHRNIEQQSMNSSNWNKITSDVPNDNDPTNGQSVYINMSKLLEREKRHVPSVAHYILSPLIAKRKNDSYNYASLSSPPSSSSSTSTMSYGFQNLRKDRFTKFGTSIKPKKLISQSYITYNVENDIFNFVFQFTRYNQTSIDLITAFNLIREWERFKLIKQIQNQREQKLKMLRYKQEYRRLDEYHRYLRHFSTMLTNEKAKQFKKAQNFHDFKKIITGYKGVKADYRSNNNNNNNNNNNEHNEKMLHSRLDPQLLTERQKMQESLSSSNLNDMQFSGGIGGGIFADSLRSRKINNREGRAIVPDSNSNPEQNVLKTNFATEFSHILNKTNEQSSRDLQLDEMNTDPTIHRKEHAYSDDELRRAFESYQEFKLVSCRPQNQTLCTEALLRLKQQQQHQEQNHHHHHTSLIIPRGIHIQRCGQHEIPRCNHYTNSFSNYEDEYDYERSEFTSSLLSTSSNGHLSYDDQYLDALHDRNQHTSCNCETLEEECLPLKVSLKTFAVAVMQIVPFGNFTHSTELIALTNHLQCGCQPRDKFVRYPSIVEDIPRSLKNISCFIAFTLH
ncbi:hypothetical protein KSF78_0007151 [Schistosoma japonicum]|nr:hypothetical protein KSF78_0007151 [Schistosoma japonicum]